MKKRKQKNLILNKHSIAKLIDLRGLRGGSVTTTDVDINTNPLTMTNCECDPMQTVNDATCPDTTCPAGTATTNPTGVTNPPPPAGTNNGFTDTVDCP